MKNCVQAASTIGWQMERDEILEEMRFVIRCGTKENTLGSQNIKGKSVGREIFDSATQIDWKRWIIDAIDQ